MPNIELPQAEFKMVLLGDSNTGKTSLVLRFVEGYYREAGRSATIGAFFLTKRLTVHHNNTMTTCKLLLWDTAGDITFGRLAQTYYQQAAAAIFTYDVSSPQSLHRLRSLLEEVVQKTSDRRMVLAIAACKCDRDPALPGLQEEAQALAARYQALYVQTSAKDNTGVQSLFEQTAERVWQCHCEGQAIPVTVGGVSVSDKAQRSRSPDTARRQQRQQYPISEQPQEQQLQHHHVSPRTHSTEKNNTDADSRTTANDSNDDVVVEESSPEKSTVCEGVLLSCSDDNMKSCCIS